MAASTAPRSQTVEDYLKAIYALRERGDDPVTTSALAERLSLSASSVSGMLRKLAARGLVEHRPYGGIALTDPGRVIALQMVRRHRLVEMFLVTHLGYGWDQVHQEAEILEHAVSDLLIERIDAVLGGPRFDPHGDPIPSATGDVPALDAHRLTEQQPGTTGRLIRVDDRDPQVLQHLTHLGIALGARIELLEQLPFGGGQLIRIIDNSSTHQFPPSLAAALWISLS